MRYKKRLSFRWLIIPLSLFVAIGFWITPALAQDVDSDGNPLSESAGDAYTLGATDMGVGTIIMENDEEFLAPPDREATADGAFGGKAQAIWINSFAFEPRFSSTGYGSTGIAHRYANFGDGVFVAPLNLPSGVRLTTVRFYIYDNTSYSIGVFLYRAGTSQTAYSTLISAEASGGSSGYKAVQFSLNHNVYNGNYQYRYTFQCRNCIATKYI
jgi:hypothetical protein